MRPSERMIATRNATIVLSDSGGGGFPLLLLHGSGSSRQIFDRQLQSALTEHFRLIAIDLPGHGDSSNALDDGRSYTLPGLATTIDNVVEALGLKRMAIFGWSLGGHIALELASQRSVDGVMIMGAPPISRGPIGLLKAFRTNLDTGLASKEKFSDADVARFAAICFGDHVEPDQIDSIRRADGKLRKTMFGSMLSGRCADERHLVETSQMPVAVVNGSEEPFVRLSYVTRLRYRALWDGMCHIIPDAGHDAFRTAPATFNNLLLRFTSDVSRQIAAPVAERTRNVPLILSAPQVARRA